MFCVFNKQKIYSYIIASSTVILLLAVSIMFAGDKMETMEMSSGTGKLVPIYDVETPKQRISITINCAWSQLRMG